MTLNWEGGFQYGGACTADGLAKREVVPVFGGDRITLQSLFMCQQVFSAAVIAHVEGMGGSDEEKAAASTRGGAGAPGTARGSRPCVSTSMTSAMSAASPMTAREDECARRVRAW